MTLKDQIVAYLSQVDSSKLDPLTSLEWGVGEYTDWARARVPLTVSGARIVPENMLHFLDSAGSALVALINAVSPDLELNYCVASRRNLEIPIVAGGDKQGAVHYLIWDDSLCIYLNLRDYLRPFKAGDVTAAFAEYMNQ